MHFTCICDMKLYLLLSVCVYVYTVQHGKFLPVIFSTLHPTSSANVYEISEWADD